MDPMGSLPALRHALRRSPRRRPAAGTSLRASLPLLLVLASAPLAGCVGTGGSESPDELVVHNSRAAAVDVRVLLVDGAGAELVNETFPVAAGSQASRVLARLEGSHTVRVRVGDESHEQAVRLEKVRDYVNVVVSPGRLGVNVVHGD